MPGRSRALGVLGASRIIAPNTFLLPSGKFDPRIISDYGESGAGIREGCVAVQDVVHDPFFYGALQNTDDDCAPTQYLATYRTLRFEFAPGTIGFQCSGFRKQEGRYYRRTILLRNELVESIPEPFFSPRAIKKNSKVARTEHEDAIEKQLVESFPTIIPSPHLCTLPLSGENKHWKTIARSCQLDRSRTTPRIFIQWRFTLFVLRLLCPPKI